MSLLNKLEQIMNMITVFKTARKALNAGKKLSSYLDLTTIVALLKKITELELKFVDPTTGKIQIGKGREKLLELLEWFRKEFPQQAVWIDVVEKFVDAVVALFKALRWFN